MMEESVTVIIPTYKRPVNLIRAVNSVLNQNYSNIEVIVVDDNSHNDPSRIKTEEVMKVYCDNPRVIYLKHKTNKNASAARNTAIKHCNSKYISFLDDDDYYLPFKIKEQIKLLKENKDANMVCCGYIKNYKGKTYREAKFKKYTKGNFTNLILSGKIDLCAGSTLLVKKELVDKIQGFDESFKRHQDWEFLIRLFEENEMVLSHKKLVVINTDGIRNYPKANVFLEIKEAFINRFSSEIQNNTIDKQSEILQYQWGEVFQAYILELKFKKAFHFKKAKNINLNLKKILNLCIRFLMKNETIKHTTFKMMHLRKKIL